MQSEGTGKGRALFELATTSTRAVNKQGDLRVHVVYMGLTKE